MENVIVRRMLAREVECKLKCILETYTHDEEKRYNEMREKTDEFLKWLWTDSPIS